MYTAAVLFAVAGLISWDGLRNDGRRLQPRLGEGRGGACHDRVTPPPAY